MGLGIRITMAMGLFMSFIGYLAYRSFQENTDLVSEDYYEKEVAYQEVIDGRKNLNLLKGKISCYKNGEYFIIEFPEDMNGKTIEGQIEFMVPSNKDFDVKQKFSTTDGQYKIDLKAFKPGPHRMQIKWQTEGKSYYYEQLIVF